MIKIDGKLFINVMWIIYKIFHFYKLFFKATCIINIVFTIITTHILLFENLVFKIIINYNFFKLTLNN